MLDVPVEKLELSLRTAMSLEDAGIHWVGELAQMQEIELLRLKNFGRQSLRELREVFAGMGLSIGMSVEGWEQPE